MNNPYDYEPMNTIIQQPVIKHDSLVDGFVVPALQCLMTGILSAIAAGTLAALLGANGWKWAAGVGVISLLYAWLSYRGGWNNRLERLLGIDLNRDKDPRGYVPSTDPAKSTRIEIIQDEGRKGDFIDLPYPDKIPLLAAGLMQGRQFAQTAWVGQGGLFSRSEFDNLRDTMIERGLVAWKNPEAKAQGVTLTLVGKAVMKRLAAPSPALPDGKGR